MLAPPVLAPPLQSEKVSAPQGCLPAELNFYQAYSWCLSPHLTACEAIEHLRGELDRLAIVPNGWQLGEVATNVFLLSGGLLNCVDEYLRGPALRLPAPVLALIWSTAAVLVAVPVALLLLPLW